MVIRLQCDVVKTLLHKATFGIVLKWPSIFLLQYVKDDRCFLYSKTIKTTQSIWRPSKLTTFEENCSQAIHPSQRFVIKPICTAVGKENVYTFADNCLDKIKKIDHTVGHERHQPKTWVELLHNRSKYKSVHASVTMLLHKLKSRACIQVSITFARILPIQ